MPIEGLDEKPTYSTLFFLYLIYKIAGIRSVSELTTTTIIGIIANSYKKATLAEAGVARLILTLYSKRNMPVNGICGYQKPMLSFSKSAAPKGEVTSYLKKSFCWIFPLRTSPQDPDALCTLTGHDCAPKTER